MRPRFDSYRLPQSKSELGELQLRIGHDGSTCCQLFIQKKRQII